MMNRTQFVLVLAAAIGIATIVALLGLLRGEPDTQLPAEDVAPTEAPAPALPASTVTTIGASVEGREIVAHQFGTGARHVLFVGGVHGGYEWNSILLAYQMIEHFAATPSAVPEEFTVSIIPNLNPDGLYAVLGLEGTFALADVPSVTDTSPGRFNARGVDLNRNFDCKWAPESTWRGRTVSAGSAPFSEPEAAALRDYVSAVNPEVVIFWHSQANTVYASECTEGVLPTTLTLMDTYAEAASYNTQATFDAYSITGDAEGWLASIGIPAITVELETRTTTEWERNLAGVEATLATLATDLRFAR